MAQILRVVASAVLLLVAMQMAHAAQADAASSTTDEGGDGPLIVPQSVCEGAGTPGGWQPVDLGETSLADYMQLAGDYFLCNRLGSLPSNVSFVPCEESYYTQAVNACSKMAADSSSQVELLFLLSCPLDELSPAEPAAAGAGENTLALAASVAVPSPAADNNDPVLQDVEFVE